MSKPRLKQRGPKSTLGNLFGIRSSASSSSIRPHPAETGINAVETAALVAKEVGEALQEVPYVKAIAGLAVRILSIRDEVQTNKERCGKIIDLVRERTETILSALRTVSQVDHGIERLMSLEGDLKEYQGFLESLLTRELEPCKSLPRWNSLINRGQVAEDLLYIEKRLDWFQHQFQFKRLVFIEVLLAGQAKESSNDNTVVPQGLPPPPHTLVGRDSIMETLLEALTPTLIFRCAIVGLGGLGKTAIATKLLHDPVVLRNYPTRLFISCEGCLTIDLLFNTLANELSLSRTDNSSILSSHIIHRIRERGKTLIVMDNLEIVWNGDTEQAKVDAFLDELSTLG
ncbi:hypothetical protein DL96DRAFT_1507685 [Flagelloscypha sp. PMI_526]|nr:hypothetical protein DL96DRAFT_1507685 [Flagelloscypha sp. PMI_526]